MYSVLCVCVHVCKCECVCALIFPAEILVRFRIIKKDYWIGQIFRNKV